MTNPLLNFDGLTAFSAVRPEHVQPAIEQLLAEAQTALEQVTRPEVPAEFETLSGILDVVTERLSRAWGVVSHLNHVMDTPALRAAHAEMLPKVTAFHTLLGSDERLYAKYQAIAAGPSVAHLSAPRRQALDHILRDFQLGGADLQGAAKDRFAEIQDRLAALSQQFSNHVLDATDAFAYFATDAEMDGVPAEARQAARAAAEQDGREGYKLTLHFPSYLPVMQYASNRALRQRMYTAYVTRASELGDPALDNSATMRELLQLRQEEARLLGYARYAELSLVAKMADTPEQVMTFLRELAQRARPSAAQDLAALQSFAATELGLPDLAAWDMPYASEKLKQARYAFSEQEVRGYFPVPKVLEGLFRIIETLFEVAVRPAQASVWHDSVQFFRIERAGQLVGEFYLDLYARPGKRPGAWMDDARHRWRRPDGGGLQSPVAQMVCNFTPPLDGRPSTLSHDEVSTLFHEFGHGLHHLLTQVEDLGVSGISGVEWDAVELPSQFMENFCWEWEVLKHLTAHVDSGQPLPRALFDKMLAAKNFQSGMQMLRQVEFSLFDMELHSAADAADRIMPLCQAVRREVAVVMPPEFNRTPHTFSHIFAGGYAAGYYSYKWAEVLSADAWGAFEEQGVFDTATGRRFRAEVLEAGGSRPALDSFKAFRGREPQIDALLRHQGIAA
jgi:oligopeptidase A